MAAPQSQTGVNSGPGRALHVVDAVPDVENLPGTGISAFHIFKHGFRIRFVADCVIGRYDGLKISGYLKGKEAAGVLRHCLGSDDAQAAALFFQKIQQGYNALIQIGGVLILLFILFPPGINPEYLVGGKLTLDNDTFENTRKSRFFERWTSRVLY